MKTINILAALLLIATLGLTSCKTDNKSDSQETQTINPADVALGPIVHDTLSANQIENIKKIQAIFSEVNSSSLEETITNFQRDQDPDAEIVIWLAMANAYDKFVSKRPGLELNKKQEAYRLILMRSMNEEADAKANVDLKVLSDAEVSEIFSYYNLESKPLTIIQQK